MDDAQQGALVGPGEAGRAPGGGGMRACVRVWAGPQTCRRKDPALVIKECMCERVPHGAT